VELEEENKAQRQAKDEWRQKYEGLSADHSCAKSKLEVLTSKVEALEKENAKLVSEVQDLRYASKPLSNNSPRIGNYLPQQDFTADRH
jgi:hypothetical protein